MSLEQSLKEQTDAVKAQTEVLKSIATSLAVFCAKNGGVIPTATATPVEETKEPEKAATKAKTEKAAAKAKAAEQKPEPEVIEGEVVDDAPEVPSNEVKPEKHNPVPEIIANQTVVTLDIWRTLTRRQKHSLIAKPSGEIDPNNPPPAITLPAGERNTSYYEANVRPVLMELAGFLAPNGAQVGKEAIKDWLVVYNTKSTKDVPPEKWDEMVNFAECRLLALELEYENAEEVEV